MSIFTYIGNKTTNFHKFLLISTISISLTLIMYIVIYAQSPDPIAADLETDGEIEIGANKSLRLKPVEGTSMPAQAEEGDLYFGGGSLYTCNQPTCAGSGWQVIADEGTIFYDNNTELLYFRSNDGTWKPLGSGGGENTVATKIVATVNSPNSERADFVCDGTEDQEKINQAIRELPAGGGAVYLLEGTYNISSATFFGMATKGIVLDKNNISLIGTGSGTVLKLVSGTSNVFMINAENVSGLFLSQFTLDGNSRTGSNNHGVSLNSVTYSTVTGLSIQGMNGNAIVLGNNTGSSPTGGINIFSNHMQNNLNGIGVFGTTTVSNNIICDNIINDNLGAGIYADMATSETSGTFNRNIIANNVIKSNTGSGGSGGGINIHIDGQQASMHNIISGNILDSNTNSYGIKLYGSVFNVVTGNKVGTNDYGIHAEGSSYIAGWTPSGSNVIANNYIANNTQNGLLLGNGADCYNNVIFSNLLFDNGGSGIGSEKDSIFLGTSANNNLISSNKVTNTLAGARNGIYISGTSNYLFSNLITGPFSRKIFDSGTFNAYTDAKKITLEQTYPLFTGTVTPAFTQWLRQSSYVELCPEKEAEITLPTGKFVGDILILQAMAICYKTRIRGGSANNVVFDWPHNGLFGHTLVCGWSGPCPATLELIWNGQYWIQMNNEIYE